MHAAFLCLNFKAEMAGPVVLQMHTSFEICNSECTDGQLPPDGHAVQPEAVQAVLKSESQLDFLSEL